MVDNSVDVQLVEKRVPVLPSSVLVQAKHGAKYHLGDTGGKNHHFIKFSHPLHELIDSWSLDHVHIMVLAFYFYRDCEVGLM